MIRSHHLLLRGGWMAGAVERWLLWSRCQLKVMVEAMWLGSLGGCDGK